MKLKGMLIMIASAGLVAAICLTPAAVFRLQDYRLNSKFFTAEPQTGKLSASARDIPLVQALWESKPVSEGFYLPHFTLMDADGVFKETFVEEPIFKEFEALHNAGVLPAEALGNVMIISINSMDSSEISGYITRFISNGVVKFNSGGLTKRYSVVSTLGKITALNLLNQNNVFSGISFDRIIKAYVAYLGLDILDDWEYKGSYAESKGAKLAVLCSLQDDLFTLLVAANL